MSNSKSKNTKEELKLLKPKNDIVFQFHRGDDYKSSKRIILVAILDYEFDITKEIKEFETIWKLCETKNQGKILTDKIEIHIIELKKVRNTYEQNKENKKAQWMMFLDDPNSKEVKEIMKENEDVKEAIIEVHKMTEDEKIQRLADLRQKAIMDEKAYWDTGRQEGIEQEKLRIVQRMLEKKIPKKQIVEITELTIEEIEKIEREM